MSKQLELPIASRRRTVVYDDPPGSEPRSVEIADVDFDDAIQKATEVVNAAGPTQEAAPTTHALVDGVLIEYTPWFDGEAKCPELDGWYEVGVNGESLPVLAWWCDEGSHFTVSNEDVPVGYYAKELVMWRGLTQPAPGGYGKDRKQPVTSRRRVVLAEEL